MSDGLSRDEDTALRCLAVLEDSELLTAKDQKLLKTLRQRDRRSEVRREGTVVRPDGTVERPS
jgi:hypothetical protein